MLVCVTQDDLNMRYTVYVHAKNALCCEKLFGNFNLSQLDMDEHSGFIQDPHQVKQEVV